MFFFSIKINIKGINYIINKYKVYIMCKFVLNKTNLTWNNHLQWLFILVLFVPINYTTTNSVCKKVQ